MCATLRPSMGKRPAKQRAPRREHRGIELRTQEHVIAYLIELEHMIMALASQVTDALAAQDAKLANLSTEIDMFISTHQGQSAADVAALVERVTAQSAAVDAVVAKLTIT